MWQRSLLSWTLCPLRKSDLWTLNEDGVSGSAHSLREEVARFLTYYCKASAHLDPENVSQPGGGLYAQGSSALSGESRESQWRPPGQSKGQRIPAEEAPGDCPLQGRGRHGHTFTFLHGYYPPSHVHCLQVVVLNGCCSVFSALAMVLGDPGGKSVGLAFPLNEIGTWAGKARHWGLGEKSIFLKKIFF